MHLCRPSVGHCIGQVLPLALIPSVSVTGRLQQPWKQFQCISTRTQQVGEESRNNPRSALQSTEVRGDERIASSDLPARVPPTTKKARGRPRKNVLPQLPPSITDGSDKHRDLSSFIDYADRTGLDKASTTFVGTHYEYTVAETLKRFKLELTRTGRRSDLGLDLLGSWSLPEAPAPMRVLLQCKCTAEKPGPAMIRELKGAFEGAPAGWRGRGVMALLTASKEATKGVRDAMVRSDQPVGFLNITTDGTIRQFLWNHAASNSGLGGLGATLRHKINANGIPTEEIALTWQGRPWPK